jgi:ribosomal protein S18 acetylase RimI-like enzyme
LRADEIVVRRCGSADIGAVLKLWEATRSSHASLPDSRADVERLVESSPAALLIAMARKEVVGAVIAGWDGWRGNIYRLAVAEGHRRRSIGRQLIRAAEDYLYGCGVRRVTALVAYDDQTAGSFWDAVGYPQDADIGRRVRNLEREPSQPEATG